MRKHTNTMVLTIVRSVSESITNNARYVAIIRLAMAILFVQNALILSCVVANVTVFMTRMSWMAMVCAVIVGTGMNGTTRGFMSLITPLTRPRVKGNLVLK